MATKAFVDLPESTKNNEEICSEKCDGQKQGHADQRGKWHKAGAGHEGPGNPYASFTSSGCAWPTLTQPEMKYLIVKLAEGRAPLVVDVLRAF